MHTGETRTIHWKKNGVIAPGQAWERGMRCNEYL
jgi:hypothetical protein